MSLTLKKFLIAACAAATTVGGVGSAFAATSNVGDPLFRPTDPSEFPQPCDQVYVIYSDTLDQRSRFDRRIEVDGEKRAWTEMITEGQSELPDDAQIVWEGLRKDMPVVNSERRSSYPPRNNGLFSLTGTGPGIYW